MTLAKKKIIPTVRAQHNVYETKPQPKGNSIGFFKNFIFLLSVVAFVLVIFKGNEGYSWIWNKLISENLKFISKNPHLTEAQRYQVKFGVDASVIDYIKNKTPESAVILFPPNEVIMNKNSSYRFIKGVGGLKIRNWALYFLYPRKLVYADEMRESIFTKDITHVACLNGWGYEFLNYEYESKSEFEVLAINK